MLRNGSRLPPKLFSIFEKDEGGYSPHIKGLGCFGILVDIDFDDFDDDDFDFDDFDDDDFDDFDDDDFDFDDDDFEDFFDD